MAPVGTVDVMGWLSSTEVGLVSLVVFLVLAVTLLALCVRCQRNSGANAYDVNGTTTDGPNGTAGTKSGGAPDPGSVEYSTWRDHKNMPASTLERKDRPKALTT